MTSDKERIRYYLKNRVRGYYNRKTYEEISFALQIPLHTVREYVRALRDEGMLIAFLSGHNICVSEKFDENTRARVDGTLRRLGTWLRSA
ncbi:MAG: hypothetical protein A2Y33_06310 [Spirochaetes bacterium GWF1_51_8]|nr:MAG: hypothetical protein A2Y33_06310 [Spirochaetes bacterium GWF1_51_8]